MTPKLHLLECHVHPCMQHFCMGLGLLNEQGMESIHKEIKNLLENKILSNSIIPCEAQNICWRTWLSVRSPRSAGEALPAWIQTRNDCYIIVVTLAVHVENIGAQHPICCAVLHSQGKGIWWVISTCGLLGQTLTKLNNSCRSVRPHTLS